MYGTAVSLVKTKFTANIIYTYTILYTNGECDVKLSALTRACPRTITFHDLLFPKFESTYSTPLTLDIAFVATIFTRLIESGDLEWRKCQRPLRVQYDFELFASSIIGWRARLKQALIDARGIIYRGESGHLFESQIVYRQNITCDILNPFLEEYTRERNEHGRKPCMKIDNGCF